MWKEKLIPFFLVVSSCKTFLWKKRFVNAKKKNIEDWNAFSDLGKLFNVITMVTSRFK